jgi:replication initiator protein RepSA
LAGDHEGLRLRLWAHQLGFRGNIATKSRLYSTTYGALRAARAGFCRRGRFDPETTETVSVWRFAGVGLSPGEAAVVAGIARDVAARRDARHAREQRDRRAGGGGGGSAPLGRLVDADRDQTAAPPETGGRA